MNHSEKMFALVAVGTAVLMSLSFRLGYLFCMEDQLEADSCVKILFPVFKQPSPVAASAEGNL